MMLHLSGGSLEMTSIPRSGTSLAVVLPIRDVTGDGPGGIS